MKRKDKQGRVLKDGEYQKNDGRYEYRYADSFSGERKSVYSWRLTEGDRTPEGKKCGKSLRELERDILEDEAKGIDTFTANKTTLNALFDKRMSLSTHLLDTTRETQIGVYDRRVRETLGKREIGKIRYSDIMSLYVSLLDNAGLSVSSVSLLNEILHATFSLAVRDGLIQRNPADGIMKELKKHSSKKKESGREFVLTNEQVNAFMAFITESGRYKRWLVMFTVLFGTGIRVSELCGLTWADCDFSRGVLRIDRSLAYSKAGGERYRFLIHPTKTEAGQREIPMRSDVRGALSAEYAAQSLTGFCSTEVDGVRGFVFWKTGGGLYQKGEVDAVINRIKNDYNEEEEKKAAAENREPVLLPHFSAHSIRHTFISRLVEVGANIKAVQSIAGHASIQTTLDIYAKASEDGKAAAISLLERKMHVG